MVILSALLAATKPNAARAFRMVGVFSGTFDPIHNGHLELAKMAYEQAGLVKVVLLLDSTPRRKNNVTDLKHRLAMCQLVANENKWLEVISLNEAEFTIAHTLPVLQRRYGKNLSFIMGSDVFEHIAEWQGIGTLVNYCSFIVGLRGHEGAMVQKVAKSIGVEAKIIKGLSPISSTQIRVDQQIRSRDTPPAVSNYILQNNLYP